MGAPGAPIGNRNAARARMMEQALIRTIKQRDIVKGEGETLREIAEKWIALAIGGDLAAITQIRDTLDGKPRQVVEGPGEDGEHTVRGLLVRLVAPDSGGNNG